MKRTHRWAAMMAALVLAAGTLLTPSQARAWQRVPDGNKQGWLPIEYFGEPDQPSGRGGRITLLSLGAMGLRVTWMSSQRAIGSRAARPTPAAISKRGAGR